MSLIGLSHSCLPQFMQNVILTYLVTTLSSNRHTKASPKFQVVIPKDLRRQLNIQIGQKLKARVCGEHIELFPEQPVSAARGFLPGLDSTVEREDGRV